MTNKKTTLAALSLILVFSLTGCGKKTNVPEFNAQYYPQCYDPIAKLCQDQDNSKEVGRAVGGAVIGGIIGGVLGGAIKGDWKGAAVGALAGAATGAAAGYFSARLEKINDQKQRLAEYQAILGEQSQNWDLTKASVENSYKCYSEQIAVLKKAYQDKKMTKEEVKARMAEIKSGLAALNAFWEESKTTFDTNMADGDQFLQQEDVRMASLQKAQQKEAARLRAEAAARSQKLKADQKTQASSVDKLSADTTAELDNFEKFFDESSKFASISQKFC